MKAQGFIQMCYEEGEHKQGNGPLATCDGLCSSTGLIAPVRHELAYLAVLEDSRSGKATSRSTQRALQLQMHPHAMPSEALSQSLYAVGVLALWLQ